MSIWASKLNFAAHVQPWAAKKFVAPMNIGLRMPFSWPMYFWGDESFRRPCAGWGHDFDFCGPITFWATKFWLPSFLYSLPSAALRPPGYSMFWAMLFYL
uniref:Uncharacterized protein n=1 Tax=Opuntia streptacantha TaxID=393608 RepID=A0A7C9E0E1_OPUST